MMVGFRKRIRITVVIAQLVVLALVCAFALGILPDLRATQKIQRQEFVERLGYDLIEPVLQSDTLSDAEFDQQIEQLTDIVYHLEPSIVGISLNPVTIENGALVDPYSVEFKPDMTVLLSDTHGKDWGLHVTYIRPTLFQQMMHPILLQILTATGIISILILLALPCLLPMANSQDTVPEHVRAALDSLAEGVLIIDQNQRIVLANDSFGENFHTKSSHFLGTKINEIPWFDDHGRWPAEKPYPWETAREQNQPQSNVLMKLKVTRDRMLSFNVNCSLVASDEKKTQGVLVSFDDISQLEASKEQLRLSRDEAQAANKAKSQFLANMSHEIRTPINAILGFTDVLRRGFDDDLNQRDNYLNTIYNSGEHLLSLINDVLDLSKIEAGHFELERIQCSPLQILHDVTDVLQVRAREKNLKLSFDLNGSIPEQIISDPTRIRQVLTNLIANAIKFTETGGVHVIVSLHTEKLDTPQLQFDVIDTGMGLSEDAQELIFNAFTQADTSVTRKYGGTGLGLTISRTLSNALGGSLTVQSELGKGSTFSFRVSTGPLSEVVMINREQAITALKSMKSAKQRNSHFIFSASNVLVVDDAEANRELVKLILERNAINVTLATNGQEALELCNEHQFDVIFMDMQMPVMDGYTATKQLRQRGFDKPIVALTANAFSGDEEKCINAGCTKFVTKPISMDELLTVLADLLGARVVESEDLSRRYASRSKVQEQRSGLPQALSHAHGSSPRNMTADVFDPFPELSRIMQNGTSDEMMQSVFSKVNGSVPPQSSARTPVEHDTQSITQLKTMADVEGTGTFENGGQTHLNGIVQTQRKVRSSLPIHDPDFRRIVTGFVEDMQPKLDEIEEAFERNDFQRLAELAHWLKGAGGTVGFQEFSVLAKQLEQTSKHGQQAESGRLIEEILETYQSIDLDEHQPAMSSI